MRKHRQLCIRNKRWREKMFPVLMREAHEEANRQAYVAWQLRGLVAVQWVFIAYFVAVVVMGGWR